MATSKMIGQKASTTKMVEGIRMIVCFTLLGGKKSPYSKLQAKRKDFAAWIIAAMIVSNYITLTEKGTPKKATGKPQPFLLRALIGSTAWSHWHANERLECEAEYIDDDGKKYPELVGITKDGLNEVNARLSGKSRGYNTDIEIVAKLAAAMIKGGAVDTGQGKYNLDSELAVRHA